MKRTAINIKGFTVVEVLVAIGIMGIVSLGIAEMFRQMAEQQRTVLQLMNKQDLRDRVLVAIRDQDGCRNTLGDKPIPTGGASTPITVIKNNATNPVGGDSVLILNQTVGNAAGDRLTVTNLQLLSQGANVVGTPKDAKVRVTYTRERSRGTSTESLDIDIKVIPKAGGLVDICYGTAFAISNICSANGGTFNQATGACDYSQLCAGGYCLKSTKGLCNGASCTTNFDSQSCPLPGQPSTWRTMVGLKNGLIQCGPSDHRVW